MKLLISLLRIIIAAYLAALTIVGLILFSQKQQGVRYPNIGGYSYYVVEDDKLLPEYPRSTFVVLKSDVYYTFDEGDYVLLKEGKVNRLRYVVQKDLDEMNVDQFVAGYTNSDGLDVNETITAQKSNVLATSYYHSSWLTLCYQILTNWMVILILIIILILSSNVTFKRFELN
jgi:hypothetical protein